jgi:hypothetical protein
MPAYSNKNGKSPVTRYNIKSESITVWFGDEPYTYTYDKSGKRHVERMKELAAEGKGLSTYISLNKVKF